MRKKFTIVLFCALIILTVSACQSETTPTPASSPLAPASTAPTSIQQEKQAVIQEIHQIVNQYNAFLEKEKSTGNYKIVQLKDGSEGVQFTNESIGKVSAEMERVGGLIVKLNEKYYKLSVQ